MKENKVFNILLLVGSSFFIYESFKLKGSSWTMSPGLFPMIVSILILAFSLVLLFRDEEEVKISKSRLKILGIICLISIIYVWLLGKIGFIAGSILYLASYMFFLGERDIKKILLISFSGPIFLYIIFASFLDVQLP